METFTEAKKRPHENNPHERFVAPPLLTWNSARIPCPAQERDGRELQRSEDLSNASGHVAQDYLKCL
jgi:hypothetical protein